MKQARAFWKRGWAGVLCLWLMGAIALGWGAIALADTPSDTAPTVVFPMPSAVTNDTRVRLGGTPIMEPINEALKQEFEAQFPGTSVDLETESETTQILESLKNGTLDLAGIGRPLTQAEKREGLQEVPVSLDQIAILVGADNPFSGSVTLQQLAQIFRGEITDWEQLGREPGTIQLVDRPATSEIRQALERYDLIPTEGLPDAVTTLALIEDDTAALVEQLGRDGVGYAIANQIRQDPRVKPVKIAILQTTLPGDSLYPYSQVRGYAYKDENNPAIRAFLGFASTEAGREALAAARREEAQKLVEAIAPPPAPEPTPEAPPTVATAPEGQRPTLSQVPIWVWSLVSLLPLGGLAWLLQQRRRARRRQSITPVTVRRRKDRPTDTAPAPEPSIDDTLDAWFEEDEAPPETPPETITETPTPDTSPDRPTPESDTSPSSADASEYAPPSAPPAVVEPDALQDETAEPSSPEVVEGEPEDLAEAAPEILDSPDITPPDITPPDITPDNAIDAGLDERTTDERTTGERTDAEAPPTESGDDRFAEVTESGDGAADDALETVAESPAADLEGAIAPPAEVTEGAEPPDAPDDEPLEPVEKAAPTVEAPAALETGAEATVAPTNDGSVAEPAAVESEVADLEAVESEPVEPELVEPEPVESEPVEPESVEPESVESESVESESVESEPVEPESVESETVDEASLVAATVSADVEAEPPPAFPSDEAIAPPVEATETNATPTVDELPTTEEAVGESPEVAETPTPLADQTMAVEAEPIAEAKPTEVTEAAAPSLPTRGQTEASVPVEALPKMNSLQAAASVPIGGLPLVPALSLGMADLAGLRDRTSSPDSQRQRLQRLLTDTLAQTDKTPDTVTPWEVYQVLSAGICQSLLTAQTPTLPQTEGEHRLIAELSAEYTPGPHLKNALLSQGLLDAARLALQDVGLDLDTVLAAEPEPGLGRGNLGRLMVCSLDALATQKIPAIGYGLRYEYGDFEQVIRQGWQVEVANPFYQQVAADPWAVLRPERHVDVAFGGHTEAWTDEAGTARVRWVPASTVRGDCYDTPIPGYGTDTVNLLRLWRAEGDDSFAKVLYPVAEGGAATRLKQQFFLVSCSVQDVLRQHQATGKPWDALPDTVALHLNDTDTLLAIAEWMRLLLDIHGLPWDMAWDLTRTTLSYTNHSLLPETLDDLWTVEVFGEVLPRHLELIYEINARFLEGVRSPGDEATRTQIVAEESHIQRMSLIAEGTQKRIRLTNLACLGTYSINGVSPLHTQLLQERVLPDFANLNPLLFSHQSNGVSPRRFVQLANPPLADLLSRTLGSDWLHDPSQWHRLEPYADDASFRDAWQQVKQAAKNHLADLIREQVGIAVDPTSLFDGQIAIIHEYKRQHLNVLHVLSLYLRLRNDPKLAMTPRTVILSGKASPDYVTAKRIIKLMHLVAAQVNGDPMVGDRLKVVFLPNLTQTLAERIYPALDLSQHLSLAGTEAADTGNIMAALNGARVLGSPDGSNLELWDVIGAENGFQFGMPEAKVSALLEAGYDPVAHKTAHPELNAALDFLGAPAFADHAPDAVYPLMHQLLTTDPYRVLADYATYLDAQDRVATAFQTPKTWHAAAIRTWARLGDFSSDRTLQHYDQTIWNLPTPDKRLRQCIQPPSG